MIKFLDSIRCPDKSGSLKKKIIVSVGILLLGLALGFISKLLDLNSFNNKFINSLDLGNFFSGLSIWLLIALTISIYSKTPLRAALNVFLFFIGVCISYHLSTIIFANFNPKNYMMIWYTITCVSPILGFISWYSHGNGFIPIIINSVILYVMLSLCFSIGLIYFDIKGPLYVITFIGTVVILYKNPKSIISSLLIGLILSFLIRFPYEL